MSIIFVFVFLLSALRLTNGNALDDVINELTKAVAKSQVREVASFIAPTIDDRVNLIV